MNKLKNIIIISLIILILSGLCTLLATLYVKERNKPPKIIKSTTVEYKYDTLHHTDSLWFPDPIYIEKPVYPQNIDTSKTIQDYYTGKIYEYNFKDTNIKFHAGIMIHKNSLVSFIPEYEIYRKTTTITNNIVTNEPPKYIFSVGGGIDYYNKLGLNISASLYFNKNDVGVFYDPILKGFGITYKRAIIIK